MHLAFEGDDFDPFQFFTSREGFGARLTGHYWDALGEHATVSAWTVTRERRTGWCSVLRHSDFADEDVAEEEGPAPLHRLADVLGIELDLLVPLLELPTTSWTKVSEELDAETIAAVGTTRATPPLLASPPRKEPSPTLSLYLHEGRLREAQALAAQQGCSLGELLLVAWELAKIEVYETTPIVESPFEEIPPPAPPPPRPVDRW